MKTLAIMSQKGGSGKTTLAVHLAAYAVGQKIKTALIAQVFSPDIST